MSPLCRLAGYFLAGVLLASPVWAEEMSPQEIVAARKLYVNKCARCHRLYEPTRYDDKAWQNWMEKMRRKARLNDTQYELLNRYLRSIRQGPTDSATPSGRP